MGNLVMQRLDMLKKIKVSITISLITICTLELAIVLSLNFPIIWTVSPNPFVAQKIYRSQRNVIQFMPECSQYDNLLGYSNRMGSCKFSNLEFDTNVHIGETGRIDPHNNDLKNYDCNVIFVGDSITFGWGVEQSQTFASIIGNKTGCKVFNLGVSSYGTAREITDLNRRGILNSDLPTHLFIQYCDNDLKENRIYQENNGILPVMSKKQYSDFTKLNVDRQEYYPLKYSWVIVKRVFQRFVTYTKDIFGCGSNCTKRDGAVQKGNVEIDSFLFAISKLKLYEQKPKVTIFELNGTNRNDCDFSDALTGRKADIERLIGTEITIKPTCGLLTKADYFVLDDHLNKNGHAKVAEDLLKNIL